MTDYNNKIDKIIDEEFKEFQLMEDYVLNYLVDSSTLNLLYAISGYNEDTLERIIYYYTGDYNVPKSYKELYQEKEN